MAGYGSDDGFSAYATAAGYTIADGANVAAARQQGSDFIDGAYALRWPGDPTGGIEQERAWPRTGATAFGVDIATDAIPSRVVNASYEAAYLEIVKPGSLSVTFDPARRVKRQKVEGVEREFFEPVDGNLLAPNAVVSSKIEGILAPLVGYSAAFPAVMIV